MAEKIYFGDDADRFPEEEKHTRIGSIAEARNYIKTLHVFAEVEDKGNHCLIRVHHNTGTGEYLARGGDELYALKGLAAEVRKAGSIDIYKIFYKV